VRLERDERQRAWAIVEILPRKSRLARRAPGGGKGERVIVANIDQVIVMFAAANPEPHPRMLDRFLVIGTPDTVIRQITRVKEMVGITHFNCSFWFGDMEHPRIMKSMQLFAKEVLPAFR